MVWLTRSLLWIRKNPRLTIEYLMIGIIISIAGFTMALWVSKSRVEVSLESSKTELEKVKGDLTSASSRLSMQEQISREQSGHIKSLQELRELDSNALAALITDYKKLADNDQKARDRLKYLETTNAAVRRFLDQPLPADYLELLRAETDEARRGDEDGGSPR